MKKIVLLVLAIMLVSLMPVSSYAAGITLPDLISDHMLIQQGKPVKLWGSAAAGETVTVKLMSGYRIISEGTATADSKGNFKAELPAVMAGGPYTLEFSTPSASKTVKDVLVGELWVHCGQSNMVKTADSTGSYANDILPSSANNEIRLFMNAASERSDVRKTDLQGSWKIADRSSVSGYSAVGYVALSKLNSELDMPVGGICCGISGAWMSAFQGPSVSGGAGAIYYNAKVAPVTQFNVRGVMWYQGESDRNTSADNTAFETSFKKLIASWRNDWNDSDMPFIYVALPPSPMKYWAHWENNGQGAYIVEDFSSARLAQLDVYNDVENTGIAVSMDCPPNPGEDPLHPNNKKPIGERLALSALGLVYGTESKWSSPLYQSASASGNTATVVFSHAYDGLKTTDGKAPRCFMAAGSDGKFYAASAEITGKNTVKLTCPQVSEIKQISYAVEYDLYPYTSADSAIIDTYPDVNLVNSEGHPLCSFRYPVTAVVPEKKIKFSSGTVETTAALGESFCFPKTVTLTGQDGATEVQSVKWSLDKISTKTEKTYSFYGLAENADVIIPAKITVKKVSDNPAPSVSAAVESGKLSVNVPAGNVQANRAMYIVAGFYKSDGTYISAKTMPVSLFAGTTESIVFSADVPDGAKTAKVMVIGQNMRLFSSEEIEIN